MEPWFYPAHAPMTAQILHAPLQPASIFVTRRIRNDPAAESEQVPQPASFSKYPFETVPERGNRQSKI
jgi:hypothetical protein